MPAEVLISFFIASLLLAIAPGPDNMFVLVHSAVNGSSSGILVTIGLCTGLIVHTVAAAIGVAAVFKASVMAFTVLKVSGALYLLFLSWQAFRASAMKIEYQKENKIKKLHLYRRGIFMNIANPKVSIFFMAFLPQFINSQYGAVIPQFFMLGGLFIIATMLVFGFIACLAGSIGKWLNHFKKSQKLMNMIAGTVFAGIALKLITVKQY